MLDGMNRPEIYPIGSTPKGRQSKGEAKLEISCQSSLICKYRSKQNSSVYMKTWKMPKYCSVLNCKSSSSDSEISLFSFPKNYTEEWIKIVKRDDWIPKKYSKICSLHFAKHHINNRRLVDGAKPIIDESLKSATVLLGRF